tara:strand:+ start:339327 stop:341072 length:1746 start_codon:yes stop_codon:yes gene_type:complete
MQKVFLFLIILFSFSLQASEDLAEYLSNELTTFEEKERYCIDEFNKSMQDLIKDDSNNLIAKAFSLASLKLSYRQLSEGGERQTLENYIKDKVRELNLADNVEFRQRVLELYEKNGESKDLSEITEIINGLDDKNYYPRAQRLSNKEGSVFMLALSMYDECNDVALCIDKNDAAITWFMGELHERAMENRIGSAKTNLMQLSVRMAHTSGVFNDTIAHSPAELSEKISDLEHDVKTAIHNHKEAFLEDFELCRVVMEDSRCLQKAFREGFDNSLSSIIKDLKRQDAIDIESNSLRLNFSDQIVLNLSNSLMVKRPDPPPQAMSSAGLPAVNFNTTIAGNSEEGPDMCGGRPFSSSVESIHAFGFDFSRIGYLTGGNTRYHKVKRLMNTFKDGISGPGIRVSAFMKTFILNYKKGRISVCCNENVEWRKNYGFNISFYGGIEAKIGYNLSFLNYNLAGIGFLAGMGISLGGGYSSPPVGCTERDHCFNARISPTVYGGGYVDAMDGWIGGELKIAWRPYVIGRICMQDSIQSDKLAKVVGDYKIGSVWLQGTLQIGWLTTYNYYKPIYTNDEDNSYAFDVFP